MHPGVGELLQDVAICIKITGIRESLVHKGGIRI
jgi:hypothetical protein